jgi:hypothetical protein
VTRNASEHVAGRKHESIRSINVSRSVASSRRDVGEADEPDLCLDPADEDGRREAGILDYWGQLTSKVADESPNWGRSWLAIAISRTCNGWLFWGRLCTYSLCVLCLQVWQQHVLRPSTLPAMTFWYQMQPVIEWALGRHVQIIAHLHVNVSSIRRKTILLHSTPDMKVGQRVWHDRKHRTQ